MCFGNGNCTKIPWTLSSLFNFSISVNKSSVEISSGNSIFIELILFSIQALCLELT